MSMIESTAGRGVDFTPILCSIPDAAAMIGRGVTWVYAAIADDTIRAVKSDKRTLVVVESLRCYAAGLPAARIKPIAKRAPLRLRHAELVAAAE
jgi:hypothetical protein